MRVRTIRQIVTFRAEPREVYELIMDPGRHSELVCASVVISRDIGGEFSIKEAGVTGACLELVPHRKIVLSWRSAGEDWPEGHYSKATFKLQATEEGTLLTFTQTGVPAQHLESVIWGWNTYYWQPMKAMLAHHPRPTGGDGA